MIHLKTPEEIEIMKGSGKRLKQTVDELLPMIKSGITTLEIDQKAEEILIRLGASSSFKRVQGYKWSTCIPINDQVVHTTPSKRKVKNGDLLTLDIGAYYKGFHTDYATSFVVGGSSDPKVVRFLEVGQRALEKGIAQAKAGNYLGQISQVIEHEVTSNGYFILKELTGHGIGRDLHEDPYVLNYLDKPVEKTYKIKPGLVIAVEVIYSMGTEDIAYEGSDGWSITTSDHSLSACFEKTVAITDKNTYILT